MSESSLVSTAAYSYDHIPTLRELLPINAGLPGVTYMQVCTHNARAAQDDGWGTVTGAKLFTINGPKGSCDMLLACKGKPQRSVSPQEGARHMHLDHDLYHATGLWLGYLPEELQEEYEVNKFNKKPDDVVNVSEKAAGEAQGETAKSKSLSDTVASL